MVRCAHQNMPPLAILTLTGAMLLLLLLALIRMHRIRSNGMSAQKKWYHTPLQAMVNDLWLRRVLGTEFELLFFGFTLD